MPFHAPVGRPRVAHNVIVGTGKVVFGAWHRRSQADGYDGMIDVVIARMAHDGLRGRVVTVVNAMLVESKVGRDLIGDTDRTDRRHGMDQVVFVAGGNVEDLGHLGRPLGGVGASLLQRTSGIATIVGCRIRIVLFREHAAIVFEIFKGLTGQSPTAPVISKGAARAFDQLFFAQARPCGAVFAGRQTRVGLQSSARRKGPATSTVALVLDGCHDSLGPPVDRQRLV